MQDSGWLAGWLAGWRAASIKPGSMGWKWLEGGKCMTLRARSEKKLHVVESEKPFWFQLRGPFLAYMYAVLRLHAKLHF